MANQFPSIDIVKISDIQMINIPSQHRNFSVEIRNGEVTKRLKGRNVDGNSIVWSNSLSFTSVNSAYQSLWYFKIVGTWLGFAQTPVVSKSYKLEEKLQDLFELQRDHGFCKLMVFKDCQLKFTIERQGDALSDFMNENALAETAMRARGIFVTHVEDTLMPFLPHFVTFLGFVETFAELHPYAQLAWSVLSGITQPIISQIEREKSIDKLSRHMKEVYEYITDAKRLPSLKETQVKALSALIQQTIECIYFLKEYAASNKASKILKGVTIDKKIDDFTKKFDHILNVMTNATDLETGIVTLRISNDIGELKDVVEESKNFSLLEGMPRAQNAGFSSEIACLPDTRLGLIKEIMRWINASDGASQRVFLLLGQAGMGKSAVAHTIFQRFREQNRSSLFCFNRSYKEARSLLFSTISRELADGDVQWRKSLVQIIEKTSIRTSLDIKTQFEELIFKPSKAANTIGPVVIVIDGLDESGDRGERAKLLDILFKKCLELPSNYRFVITSRPEPDIEPCCEYPPVFCRRMADLSSVETTSDIQKYISARLSSVENILNEELNCNWPFLLAERAEGLFQWARLACDIINPDVKFNLTERARNFFGSTSSLYQMYHQIFRSQEEFNDEDYLPAFKTVMRALVIMREPLSIRALKCLLQDSLPHKIESIMDPFRSLFLGTHDLDTPVRPLHSSLTDFLTTDSFEVSGDTKKIKILNQFCVNASDQGSFTLACLKLMNSGEGGLRFNICNLETSHLRNQDVPKLDDRVQKEIPSHLSYASYFWAVHLQQSKVSEDLLIQLRHLIRTNILYLFETLSLLKKSVDQVCVSMKFLVDWCKGIDDELALQTEDACQFGYDFGDAMVESTPHLYISALPLAPKDSFIWNRYLHLFPRHFNIELGQSLGLPRNSNVMKRHPNSKPTAIAFSPQGKYIATGFGNGEFWLWDYKTGEIFYQWKTDEWQQPEICTIVFSPNGKSVTLCLLNGSFNTLDIQQKELVSHSYGVFEQPCRYSTISSNGCYLVFHSYHQEILLYNVTSHSTTQLGFLGHKSVFSPNGELLATLCGLGPCISRKKLSIWSTQEQKLIGSDCHTGSISALAFSPDGNHIALLISGRRETPYAIEIWDVLITARVYQWAVNTCERVEKTIIFSPDGQNVFFNSELGIRIMDISTGGVRTLPRQNSHFATSLAVSSDCKHVAWCAENGVIQVQECESTPRRARSDDDGLWYIEAMFSPLNTYLFLRCLTPDGNVNRHCYLQILNTATMTIIARVELESERSVVAISPNDEYIAYATTFGLCLWSNKGRESVLDSSHHKFTSLAFSFGGDRLISGNKSGAVTVWNTQTHTHQLFGSSHIIQLQTPTPILALAFSGTGMQFLVAYKSGSNNMIEIRSSQSGNFLRDLFIKHSNLSFDFPDDFTLAFSANETHIVYTSSWTMTIIDARAGQILKTFERASGNYNLKHGISPNRKYIVVTKGELGVEVRDIETGEAIDGSAIMAAFSNSSEEFATVGTMGEINFWDISSGNKLARPTFNNSNPDSRIIAMNNKYLVLGRRHHAVEVWSLDTHQNVFQHQPNGPKSLMSSVDHSEVELAIHDQSSSRPDDEGRTEYALEAWKNALFSESSRIKNGWILGPNGELLFWVPEERREGLWRPKMAHLIGTPITKLSFENFVHGSRWTECKEKL